MLHLQLLTIGSLGQSGTHDMPPPERLLAVAVHRPVLDPNDTVHWMSQLLKPPEGQIHVVSTTTAPELAGCLVAWQLLDAWAAVTNFDVNRAGVVPARDVLKHLLLAVIACM